MRRKKLFGVKDSTYSITWWYWCWLYLRGRKRNQENETFLILTRIKLKENLWSAKKGLTNLFGDSLKVFNSKKRVNFHLFQLEGSQLNKYKCKQSIKVIWCDHSMSVKGSAMTTTKNTFCLLWEIVAGDKN